MMTMGSLFDGIGGFPLAAIHNGIIPVWASEIEAFPIQVTKLRFPQMQHTGDITKLNGKTLPLVDVICGGSPCQDLSVAGQRRGLAGERSGLFMEQVRIVKEMRNADENRGLPDHLVRPRYLVWENVPGAFSSAQGEDFRAVIEEIVRIKDSACHVPRPDTGRWEPAGATILGDRFSLAWRVLDAQYWGVAQRRRRIFLVADFGGHTAPQILFEQDRLFGDSSESQSAGQGTAGTASQGTDHTGGTCLTPWDVQSRRIFSEDTVWPALYGGEGGGHGYIQKKEQENAEQVLCLNDQGGERMDITEGFTATLRAGMSGHPPLVAEQTAVSGVVTKGNGDCFLTPDVHTSLTGGGGQAGQGYPCVLTAGFCGNASAEAGGIGYQSERSPTLKTGTAPSILCLNDQGESEMHLSEAVTGTLQEQEHGYQPLVLASGQGGAEIGTGICPTITEAAGTSGNNQPILFENHGIDSRYTGPHAVAPTMSARYGTGGNNVPLISDDPQSYCIAGNIIDREVQNGGNGLGCQPDISYTLTGMDRHAVFSRQRSDELVENEVVSTQSARQHKDATDLVCQPDIFGQSQYGAYAEGCTTLRASGGDHGGGSENLVAMSGENPAERRLIRRLTPLECERLQGFPDGWTDMPGASDSARYKALGNSVAIPCVDFVLRGIAYFLCRNQEE
ncbi:DNA cytosine methyltransferase [Pilosibacter fragilis]|uniref:DNA cytosine methyltransferase n=1 Tax=Pilosibacter fragilis TaxID=3078042 RepID=UPI0031BBA9CE